MRWCLKEYHRFVPVPFTPSISKYASIDVWKWVKDLFQKSTLTLSLNRNRDFLAMLKSTSRKPIVQRTLLLRRFFRLPLRCVWTGLRYFFGRIEAIFCRMFYVFVVRRLTVYSSIFLLTTNAQHFTNIFTVNTTGFFAHQCNCGISRTHTHTCVRAHTHTYTNTCTRLTPSCTGKTEKREKVRAFKNFSRKSGKSRWIFEQSGQNSNIPIISI